MFSPPPTTRAAKWIAFVVCLSLALTSITLFYAGFFPSKVVVSGEASFRSNDPYIGPNALTNPTAIPTPKFKKAIFMLVDSLRSDFISNPKSGFTFVRSLLSQGKAFTYKTHAHPPTVTLPRVKALVTGGIPSFSDYLNNFQSSAIDQDNIVWQLQRHSKCVVFYGDDTWVKLFPDSFTRYEGTTSFFVTDTVIVDNNVTRNLPAELERYKASRRPLKSEEGTNTGTEGDASAKSTKSVGSDVSSQGDSKRKLETSTFTLPPESAKRTVCEANADWDVMILHYLGLDHVGHLEGPRSPLMYPKQVEMNDIFERLYKAIDEDTLLIMSGDHGMNEDGAHGGPSAGETSPALVLASPAFSNSREDRETKYGFVDQIDLAPTLCTLMGIPTPLNSVGKLIPDVIEHMYASQPQDMLRAYQLNANQIHRLLKTSPTICEGGNIKQYHKPSLCNGMSDDARKAIFQLNEAKKAHQDYAQSAQKNDVEKALQSYLSFLETSSLLFARALSEYDDYLLFSAMIGFAATALFAASSFFYPLHRHPPPLLILVGAILHFVFDSSMLVVIGSNLATLGSRIWFSLLMGYCLAHLISCARTFLQASSPSFTLSTETWAQLKQSLWNSEENSWRRIVFRVLGFVGDWFTSPADTNNGRFVGFVVLFGLTIRPLLYSSSSFIEEEHLTFFYLCCTSIFALLHYVIMQGSGEYIGALTIGIVLVAMRTCRLWNQTGFQGIGMPDVAQMLNGRYTSVRNLLVVISFALIMAYVVFQLLQLIRRTPAGRPSSYSSVWGASILKRAPFNVSRVVLQLWLLTWCFALVMTFLFQTTGSHSWATMARYSFLLAFLLSIAWFYVYNASELASIIDCVQLMYWTISGLGLLMCRYHNVPLLFMWLVQAHGMLKLAQGFAPISNKFTDVARDWINVLSPDSSSPPRTSAVRLPFWIWSLLMFNLGQYAYFSQGNSNSLASIDIAGAYAGLSGYQDSLVGLFVGMLMYSGPITFHFTLVMIFICQEQDTLTNALPQLDAGSKSPLEQPLHLSLFECLKVRLMGRGWALIIYSIFITMHRGHLFIWTVFAPKLLYEVFHSIAFVLQTLVYFVFSALYVWHCRRVKAGQTFDSSATWQRPPQQQVHHVHPHHAHTEPYTSHHAPFQPHHTHQQYQPNFVTPIASPIPNELANGFQRSSPGGAPKVFPV